GAGGVSSGRSASRRNGRHGPNPPPPAVGSGETFRTGHRARRVGQGRARTCGGTTLQPTVRRGTTSGDVGARHCARVRASRTRRADEPPRCAPSDPVVGDRPRARANGGRRDARPTAGDNLLRRHRRVARRRVVDARYGGERPRFGDRRKGVFRRRGPSRTSHDRAGTSRTRAWVDSHPSSCSGGIVMTPTHMRHRTALGAAGVAAGLVALVGCSGGGAADGGTSGDDRATVTNCGEKRTYPQPAERLFVNGDGNMMATVLAVGAAEQVVGVGGLGEAVETLGTVYGEDRVDELPVVSDNYPSFENVIAQTPDVVFSGWGYGWEEK